MTSKLQNKTFTSRTRMSRVRSVSQVMLTFKSDDPKMTFGGIRKEALHWLANRAGRQLPKRAWDGESFDTLETGAQPISALSLENPYYWCFRLIDADKTVAQRSWHTEAGILLNESNVLFGCRLQCVALGDSSEFAATVPGLVAQMVGLYPAYLDERRVSVKAWHVDGDDEAGKLVELLLNPERTRPVIVVSLGDKDGHDGQGVIEADDIARLTVGAAHVVTITGDASYALTDHLGREFSVFHRAVRTYRPGLNLDEDSPGEHPIALPGSIEQWIDGGAVAFKRFLVDRVLRDTIVGVDIYRQLPSFADIHAQALNQRRSKASEHGASDKEMLALALEENESLRRKLEEREDTYNGLLQAADADLRQIKSERDQARGDVNSLHARIKHLEVALIATGKKEETPIPDSFDEIEEWCRKYLSGSVHVMPRAFKIATKSDYENPALAYKTLLIFRDCYVPMKREGGMDKKKAYDQALASLGLEDSQCFAGGARAGEQGDEYRVTYNGRQHYLDRHIKGSSSREERFGFRLYFFWDDDSQQAVVGSFPTHLSTRAT